MRVLIAVALLMLCVALAQKIEPQAAKQEKAQPWLWKSRGANACLGGKDCTLLPFDIPAKWHSATWHDTAGFWTCNGAAPDWQKRVLLDSADGKHHCYAFYLLSPQRGEQ